MPRPKKKESERKKAVSLMLSPKTIQALDYFSEMVNLSKSVIVSLALSQYLEKKDVYKMTTKIISTKDEEKKGVCLNIFDGMSLKDWNEKEIKNRFSNIGEAIGSIALEYIVKLEKENQQLKQKFEKAKNHSKNS